MQSIVSELIDSALAFPEQIVEVATQGPITAVLVAFGALFIGAAMVVFGVLSLGAVVSLVSPS